VSLIEVDQNDPAEVRRVKIPSLTVIILLAEDGATTAVRDRVRCDIKKQLRIANGPSNDDKMASEARKAAKKTRRALIKEEVLKRQAELNKAFEGKYGMSISDWSKPGAYVDSSRFFLICWYI